MDAPPIYPIGTNKRYSIFDLLNNFSNTDFNDGKLSRISDLHVKIGEPPSFRVDETLTSVEGGAICTQAMVEGLLYPLLSTKQIDAIKKDPTTDIDTGFYWEERKMAFRINAFHDRDGLAFVIRMLPLSIPDIQTFGFPAKKVWEDIVQMQQGLVLISGVTGSGKSTLMNTFVKEISIRRACRIITLEDPIEYVHPSSSALISQREVGTHMKSFAQGLKSALREDPDIILLGEMRDPETIALALTAAETGHLVLSTVHTRDTTGALTRIMDCFAPERQNGVATQMSFSIAYAIAQKLIPRLDGKGRIPAMEILKVNGSVANQIRQANFSQIYSTMETASHEGMNTLEFHLSELYQKGLISQEDAVLYANDPRSLDI